MMYLRVYDHTIGDVVLWRVSQETFERAIAPYVKGKPMNYVCADCGTENETMNQVCTNCASVRVVLKSLIEDALGPDWKEKFGPPAEPVTRDHPDVKEAERLGAAFMESLKKSPL